jgi:hypothetical protein
MSSGPTISTGGSQQTGRIYHVYCDESSTDKGHKYSVFAGVMIDVDNAKAIKGQISTWRNERQMHGEMKWTKTSKNKLVEYTDYASMATGLIKRGPLCFQALSLECKYIDYKKHHSGDSELGFYKFLYQLLFHKFCKKLKDGDVLHIFVDHRRTSYNFESMRNVLNRNMGTYCQIHSDPVQCFTPIDSRISELMQFNDVLMGAAGFHYNERHLEIGTSPAKIHLASHIAKEMSLPTLACDTSLTRCMGRFGLWNLKLKK